MPPITGRKSVTCLLPEVRIFGTLILLFLKTPAGEPLLINESFGGAGEHPVPPGLCIFTDVELLHNTSTATVIFNCRVLQPAIIILRHNTLIRITDSRQLSPRSSFIFYNCNLPRGCVCANRTTPTRYGVYLPQLSTLCCVLSLFCAVHLDSEFHWWKGYPYLGVAWLLKCGAS